MEKCEGRARKVVQKNRSFASAGQEMLNWIEKGSGGRTT